MLTTFHDIAGICENLRNEGKIIVFTNGCFDIIHPGHTIYLRKAKEYGDVLVIGLNSDDSVRRLKGPERPLNNVEDRAEVLSSLKPVDFVVVFSEDTPLKLIEQVKPNVLVKGGDYTKDKIVGADFVESGGGKVVVIPYVAGKSTSSLLDKIKKL